MANPERPIIIDPATGKFRREPSILGQSIGSWIESDGLNGLRWMNDGAGAGRPPTYLYLDGSRPDDSGNGLSWATAKKTLEGVSPLVPNDGYTYIYCKGTGANRIVVNITGCFPRINYNGNVRLIGCDAWEEIATGAITGFTSAGGFGGYDRCTVNMGAYPCADATDRALWIEITDSTDVVHLRKIYYYDAVNGYDIDKRTFVFAAGKPARIVKPTTEIYGQAYPLQGDLAGGSVQLIGFKITQSATNVFLNVNPVCCHYDAAVTQGIATDNYGIGMLRVDNYIKNMGAFGKYLVHGSAIVGTPFEGKVEVATTAFGVGYFPGGFHKTTGGANALLTVIAPFSVPIYFYGIVLENCDLFVGGKYCMINLSGIRIVDPLKGILSSIGSVSVINTSTSRGGLDLGTVTIINGIRFIVPSQTVPSCRMSSLTIEDGTVESNAIGTYRDIAISRPAAHDSIAVWVKRLGNIRDVTFTGGYSLATPGTPRPAISVEGGNGNFKVNMSNTDRGVGPMVKISGGSNVKLEQVIGNNTNAGAGRGMDIDDPSFVEVTAAQATAVGSGGAGTAVKVGSLAVQPWPVFGNRVNDISAVPAATDTQAQLKMV